jgi:hypothetical protein
VSQLLGLYIQIAVIALAVWAVVFFALIPYLTGKSRASFLSGYAAPTPVSDAGWKLIQLTVGGAPLAFAPTAVVVAPVVVIIQTDEGTQSVAMAAVDGSHARGVAGLTTMSAL